MRKFFHDLKYIHDVKCFPVSIVTTYACNFKCVYCFEAATRSREFMTDETCDLAVDWIKRWSLKAPYKKIYLTFYGGEPLLNTRAVDRIVTAIKPWCERAGVDFAFMFQTNGYLLSPGLVKRYLPLGLNHVRISVDGVKGDHDKNRILANGQGTFDAIMSNIRDCIDMVNIGLSVSYEKDEVDHIERLLDYLEGLGALHKLGRFLFAPIHPRLGDKNNFNQIERSECLCNYEDRYLIEANRKLAQFLQRKKLPSSGRLAAFACSMTRENGGVTIDTQGRLFRCNCMLGHPELSIGHIKDQEFNRQQRYFRDLDVWKKCPIDCPYLPLCGGGCRMVAFLKDRDFSKLSCKKEYLDKMAPEFIKAEYLQETRS
ncbi:MAG: radical SAM protein [Candidatus Omnitrophota bacterium]